MKPCPKTCPNGHKCRRMCYQECDCDELVLKTLMSCGHKDKVRCSLPQCEAICSNKCLTLLSCGHHCPGQCGTCRKNGQHDNCTETVTSVWPCGHESEIKCCQKSSRTPCPKQCGATLDCGHMCKGLCSDCLDGAVHVACEEKCGERLPCGHKCQGYCGDKCLPCTLKCPDRCSHGYCSTGEKAKLCSDKCRACTKPCSYSCIHFKCSKLCSEFCDTPPCNERCNKKVHKCSRGKKCTHKLHICTHTCSGLCGEECVCAICEQVPEIVFPGGKVSFNSSLGQLTELMHDDVKKNDRSSSEKKSEAINKHKGPLVIKLHCGHIFRVDDLDRYVSTFDEKGCRFLSCPVCQQLITESRRYERIIKERRSKRLEHTEYLRQELYVSIFHIRKITLSEKEFSKPLTFSKHGGKTPKYFKSQWELSARSFQLKCAYVLTLISSLGGISAKVIDSVEEALRKICLRVTTQQRKEFTKELLRLLHLTHVLELQMLALRSSEPLKKVEDILNASHVDRQTLEDSEEIINRIATDITSDDSFQTRCLEKYSEVTSTIEKAKKVLLSSDDQMLCDILSPQSEYCMTNESSMNRSPEGEDEDQRQSAVKKRTKLHKSAPKKSLTGILYHGPMPNVSIPLSQLPYLPSLQEWDQKSQSK